MHERKNCLEHQRLNDLVFVQYNMSLKQILGYRERVMLRRLSGNTEWMAVDPPLGDVMLLGPQIDDIEALGAGFDDREIFDAVKDTEEENGEEEHIGQPLDSLPKRLLFFQAAEEHGWRLS
ncbi:UNVERIFIED_CONTAM: hypothetical protein Sangu_0776900 [Sesamum angustifolium]|uniref:Uncharacterized protein n=1 Tax=Sesamum angustifolium TaxID=2727405 RepID=A0AAW2PUT7_9LAMI